MLTTACSSGSGNNSAPLNVEKPNIVVDALPASDSAGLQRVVSAMLTFGLLPPKDRSFRIQAMTGS